MLGSGGPGAPGGPGGGMPLDLPFDPTFMDDFINRNPPQQTLPYNPGQTSPLNPNDPAAQMPQGFANIPSFPEPQFGGLPNFNVPGFISQGPPSGAYAGMSNMMINGQPVYSGGPLSSGFVLGQNPQQSAYWPNLLQYILMQQQGRV